jgi:hypothetical protein
MFRSSLSSSCLLPYIDELFSNIILEKIPVPRLCFYFQTVEVPDVFLPILKNLKAGESSIVR